MLGLIMRWSHEYQSKRIHLAVQGSVGGTSLGLHIAADVIEKNGRVIWVGEQMPNNQRFAQLFSHLSPVASSRFHAMLIAGSLDKASKPLIDAAINLPSVELIVIDDWCENSGKIPKSLTSLIFQISNDLPKDIMLLLISKGNQDAGGSDPGTVRARSEAEFVQNNFAIWKLSRESDGPFRTINIDGNVSKIITTDNGFNIVD